MPPIAQMGVIVYLIILLLYDEGVEVVQVKILIDEMEVVDEVQLTLELSELLELELYDNEIIDEQFLVIDLDEVVDELVQYDKIELEQPDEIDETE